MGEGGFGGTDGSVLVEVALDEGSVFLKVVSEEDDGTAGEAVGGGVEGRAAFSFFAGRSRAALGVANVGEAAGFGDRRFE
jgi:hypothetical protein